MLDTKNTGRQMVLFKKLKMKVRNEVPVPESGSNNFKYVVSCLLASRKSTTRSIKKLAWTFKLCCRLYE